MTLFLQLFLQSFSGFAFSLCVCGSGFRQRCGQTEFWDLLSPFRDLPLSLHYHDFFGFQTRKDCFHRQGQLPPLAVLHTVSIVSGKLQIWTLALQSMGFPSYSTCFCSLSVILLSHYRKWKLTVFNLTSRK